jgi:hypothetical protein
VSYCDGPLVGRRQVGCLRPAALLLPLTGMAPRSYKLLLLLPARLFLDCCGCRFLILGCPAPPPQLLSTTSLAPPSAQAVPCFCWGVQLGGGQARAASSFAHVNTHAPLPHPCCVAVVYMAPELMADDVMTAAADTFALGVVRPMAAGPAPPYLSCLAAVWHMPMQQVTLPPLPKSPCAVSRTRCS